MTTNTDPVRALIEKWRGTHGSGFTSQGEFQAHLSTLRTCADELEAAIASAPPSAPVGVEGLLADLETIWHSVSDDKETNAAYQRLKAALAQQPAAPSGVPVAWAAMSAAGSRVVSISLERDEYVGHVVPLYTAPQQPAAVDEAGTWSKRQPACPGIYGIRGFNLCRPASEQFEAVVVVREYGGELVCNLHESTSEDDLESWAPICDLDPDFEWRAFVPGWEQRGGRALAAQQQGGA